LAWTFSIAAHLVVFALLFWPHAQPMPHPVAPAPILVSLVELPKPEQPGPAQPPGPPTPAPAAASSPQIVPRPVTPHHAAPAQVLTAAAAATSETYETAETSDNSDLLSDSQLVGAVNANDEGIGGGGGGSGGCDTERIVQQALQRDPLVRTAVEDAHRLGKAVMLWNGDWVRSGDQDGKGLSAVREAIIWELAFAPEACRNKRVHGLVLLSLADGNTRFAIGSGDWRWSDLLEISGVPAAQ
jgi:hypothetical protein